MYNVLISYTRERVRAYGGCRVSSTSPLVFIRAYAPRRGRRRHNPLHVQHVKPFVWARLRLTSMEHDTGEFCVHEHTRRMLVENVMEILFLELSRVKCRASRGLRRLYIPKICVPRVHARDIFIYIQRRPLRP